MSANTDPNLKTDNLANEDCRPVPCSAEYRIKAKQSLMAMFRIPEGFSSGEVESIVDNIIWAAVHQVAELQMEAMKQNAIAVAPPTQDSNEETR